MTTRVEQTPQKETANERDLVRFFCASGTYRSANFDRAARLFEGSAMPVVLELLKRLRLVALVGSRIMSSGIDVTDAFATIVMSATKTERRRGEMFEVVTSGIVDALENAGVRTLPVKGSLLARQLYGDVGLRTSNDIDVLVAAADLDQAVAVASAMGWTLVPRRSRGLPLLHETLVHPHLPNLEVHWRLHWYESQFSSDALARAERRAPDEPLRMQPVDELASLLLFYQRDGFAGLRSAADISTWWSGDADPLATTAAIEAVADQYPDLARAVRTAAEVSSTLGCFELPVRSTGSRRVELAKGLINPFLVGDDAQVRADISLIDLLLAPPGGHGASIRRELSRAPQANESHRLARVYSRLTHGLKFARRWVLGLNAAATRAAAARKGLRAASGPS